MHCENLKLMMETSVVNNGLCIIFFVVWIHNRM